VAIEIQGSYANAWGLAKNVQDLSQPNVFPGVWWETTHINFMKNPWIIPAATLVVGAAGGFFAGKGSPSDTAGAKSGEVAQSSRSSSSGRSEAGADKAAKKARVGSLADISKMPGNSTRVQALMDFYAGLSAEQLAEEAGKLESLPMNERMLAGFLLFGRWAEVDPTAAMSFSNTMGMAGNFVRPTILQSWASVDPANAAKYYQDNPREFAMMGMFGGPGPGRGGQNGASVIASEWARQDPAAAMAWASSLQADKGAAMNSVIGEVAKTDPRKASEMIGQLDAADRADAYRSVASQYGALDFVEAQSWIRGLPADEQAAALASAIGGLSNTNPAEAAKQVALMEAGEAKDRAIAGVVEDLARVDPQAAANLLQQLGDDEGAMRDGMRNLMSSWTNQNPAAALIYANTLQGESRDNALQTYVFSNRTTPSADLVKVAASIEDDGDRQRSIGMAVRGWMREDKAAATSYMESSTDLSDEAKERITSGEPMWGGRGGPGGNGGGRRNRGNGGGGGGGN